MGAMGVAHDFFLNRQPLLSDVAHSRFTISSDNGVRGGGGGAGASRFDPPGVGRGSMTNDKEAEEGSPSPFEAAEEEAARGGTAVAEAESPPPPDEVD